MNIKITPKALELGNSALTNFTISEYFVTKTTLNTSHMATSYYRKKIRTTFTTKSFVKLTKIQTNSYGY